MNVEKNYYSIANTLELSAHQLFNVGGFSAVVGLGM